MPGSHTGIKCHLLSNLIIIIIPHKHLVMGLDVYTHLRVHVVVKLRLPHESCTTDKALIGLLVAVNKPVSIPVIPTIKGFPTDLKSEKKTNNGYVY